jgi:catechol-2,3-dioxygenase
MNATPKPVFNRASEDLGNIVNLGHVNFRVPDQGLATAFYMTGLGLTRDPFMMTGTNNMWVNAGDSQFHLPTGPATVAEGVVTGLVVPDLDDLEGRLERVSKELAGSRFCFRRNGDVVEATCPWGNRFVCHAPDAARFGPFLSWISYVRFEVARGAAEPIARFYREVMGAVAHVEGSEARVSCGHHQTLIFAECDAPLAACLDHHIQIYLADFAGPYQRLQDMGLRVDESSQWQYRFISIPDMVSGREVFPLDHEVRSMTHPMFGRQLINRNPAQTIFNYRGGQDALNWRMA